MSTVSAMNNTKIAEFIGFWKAVCSDSILSTRKGDSSYLVFSDGAKWLSGLSELYVRNCYHELRKCFVNDAMKGGLLKGTPGIGKSLFLRWLMACLAREAIERRETDVTFGFSFLMGDNVIELFCALTGCVQYYHESHGKPTYFFSDSVDISSVDLSTKLTLLVSSDDPKHFTEWQKRLDEHDEISAIKFMPVFSVVELVAIAPLKKDAVFRFDIVGGNARQAFAGGGRDKGLYAFVEKHFDDFFQGIPVATEERDWACLVVSKELCRTTDTKSADAAISSFVVSSFFKNIQVDSKYDKEKSEWASTFLKFLAGAIAADSDSSMLVNLKNIFGGSGMGVAYEYYGHQQIFENRNQEYPVIDLITKSTATLRFRFDKKAHLRKVKDISTLKDDEYGIPTTCNFPFGDAFIKTPRTIFQFTTGLRHRGAMSKLPAICDQLKGEGENAINLVYVVPQDKIGGFTPENIDLPYVKQYLTTDIRAVNEESLMKLYGSKKRK